MNSQYAPAHYQAHPSAASQYGPTHCRPHSSTAYSPAPSPPHHQHPRPVLLCAIDTLMLSYRADLHPDTASLLQNLQLHAHKNRYPSVTIAGLPFSLNHRHNGSLVCPTILTVFLRPAPYYTTVELRSRYLHHHDYRSAVALVRRVVHQLFLAPLSSERVSRVDLHADLVGWPDSVTLPWGGVSPAFVSRARKRRTSKYGSVHFGRWHGRRTTTSCSIYRKDAPPE